MGRMKCSGMQLSYNHGEIGIKRFSPSEGALKLGLGTSGEGTGQELCPELQLCKPSDAIFRDLWQDVLSYPDSLSL